MKKMLLTLVVAVLATVMGTQRVFAEPEYESLEVWLKTGTNIAEDDDLGDVLNLLFEVSLLRMEQDGYGTYVCSANNEKLFRVDDEHVVTLEPGVGEADDISYTLTAADWERNSFLKLFKSVQLHFGEPTKVMEITLETGTKVDESTQLAVQGLLACQQILLDEDGLFMSADYKVLFMTSEDVNGIPVINLAPGVTSADDIYYTLSDADRKVLNDMDAGFFFRPYKSIHLRFSGNDGPSSTILAGTLKTGWKQESVMEPTYMAFYFLFLLQQLQMAEDGPIFLSAKGKPLFMRNDDGMVFLCPGVSASDDIVYTITDADRKFALEMDECGDFYRYLFPYTEIQLHFDDSCDMSDLELSLMRGQAINDNDANELILLFTDVFNLLAMEEDGDSAIISSQQGKQLFTVSAEGIVHFAPGLSAADDICFTMTTADREKLFEYDKGLYVKYTLYKTLQLHFLKDLVCTLRPELNLNDEKNEKILTGIDLLTNYFYQLRPEYDLENGTVTFYTTDEKPLFTFDEDGYVTLAPGVTAADGFSYTIEEGDLEYLMAVDEDLYQFISPYETIQLCFGEDDRPVLQCRLVTGVNLSAPDRVDDLKALGLMMELAPDLLWYQVEADKGETVIYAMPNKELFRVTDEGVVTVASGVTEADNVTLVISRKLRKEQKDNPEQYELLETYRAIQLCFGTALRGDLDGDGHITVDDITLLIGIYLGEGANPAADLGGDGHVTVDDITQLISIYLSDEN